MTHHRAQEFVSESRPSNVRQLLVRKIAQLDRHTLGIEWVDGHRSHWRLSTLRRSCPCASCVDEWTGEPLLDAKSVDQEIVASLVESVGRYALRIRFSDGHDTGIYTFTLMRQLCECEECEARRAAEQRADQDSAQAGPPAAQE